MKRLAYGLIVLGGMGLLAACSAEKKSLGLALQTNDLVFADAPETLPDKVNVYTSMARAAKYNADATAQNMLKKIYDGNENPKEIARGILDAGQSGDKLYNAARAMDFADIYAMSVLTDNQKYIENALYAKSAQNLSVAAIKLHREEIFAEKEIKEIDRIMASQGEVLSKLNAKNETGDLTEPEINYRKGLEVALNNLAELKNQLVYTRSEYTQLIRSTDKDLRLEGKRFYELDDFDKRYTPDIFQDSAISNRREFVLAKEKLGAFNAAKARRQAFVDYPPVARLDINGLEIEDTRYEAELFNKAKRVTMNLIAAVEEFQSNPSKDILKQKVFDELAALVMTQVEVSYRLVEKATYDYDDNRYKLGAAKEVVRQMEKKKSLPDYEKVDLLNKRTEVVAYEQREAQILAERAAALRNLYYQAGLSPFDKTMLKGRIKDIEVSLKTAFNKDLVTMLSAVKEAPRWDDGGNAWAHKDNWLEELIDGPEKAQSPVKPASKAAVKQTLKSLPVQMSAPVVQADKHSMIQLGAYTDMDNAIADQKEILTNVSALNGYDIFIEESVVNGTLYHRLLVKPEAEKLGSLCQAVIDSGFDCLLR